VKEEAPTSECISGIQQRLNNLNINAGPVDGIYGPNTRAAIAAFQKLYKLSIAKGHEGEPNETTRNMLFDIHDQTEIDPRPPESGRG
jgi:peptidoglycan hydrolase-like protein with peptidoglycan-binding domain